MEIEIRFKFKFFARGFDGGKKESVYYNNGSVSVNRISYTMKYVFDFKS